MRKLLYPFVLCFAMLLTQLGALQHELSHYSRSESASQVHKHSGDSRHCDICLAFAHAAGAVRTESFVFRVPDGMHVHHAAAVQHASVVHALVRRNRDPPFVL